MLMVMLKVSSDKPVLTVSAKGELRQASVNGAAKGELRQANVKGAAKGELRQASVNGER